MTVNVKCEKFSVSVNKNIDTSGRKGAKDHDKYHAGNDKARNFLALYDKVKGPLAKLFAEALLCSASCD